MVEQEFQNAIDSIGLKIDSLPDHVRPKLIALLDETIQRRGQIQDACRKSRKAVKQFGDIVAELDLIVKQIVSNGNL